MRQGPGCRAYQACRPAEVARQIQTLREQLAFREQEARPLDSRLCSHLLDA